MISEELNKEHHGEPVAWMYKRKGAEKELGQLVTMESEDIKGIRLGKCYGNGTRYLWPREDYIDWKPLYTHADPAEVERLRAELVEWKERWQCNSDEAMSWMGKHDTLRAQLAEAHAIIERVKIKELVAPSCPLGKRIEVALSASAERNQCNTSLTMTKD